MRIAFPSVVAAVALLLAFSTQALAERYVVVNGQRLGLQDIMNLERLHCGPIANGSYWINFQSGYWGYAGNPRPMGHIRANCYRQNERRPSLSERGLLFGPGDWVR